MSDSIKIAQQQLGRMRGMTALYHRRFFTDVWLTLLLWLALVVAGDLGSELAFVMLPFVALFGAVITAFDASYLIFARHYAAALERYLNDGSVRRYWSPLIWRTPICSHCGSARL